MERQEYIDELLVKSLLGEADDAQEEFVRNWRARNSDNERYCRQFEQLWLQSRDLAERKPIDVEAAWSRFQTRIAEKEMPKRVSLWRRTSLRIAAGLLVILGISAASFRWWTGTLESTTGSEILRQELPDGSFVTMNKNSSLRFPRHFSGDRRIVELNGEAFFSVTPDKSHPFLIKANGVLVRVVGTSFNVKSNGVGTEVIVETGVVEVSGAHKSLSLQPRERAWLREGDVPRKDVASDKLYNYYRTNEFICDHTPLARLVAVLEDAYGQRIEIADPEKAKLELTANYRNDGLQSVLSIVCETLNLEARDVNGVIVIQ